MDFNGVERSLREGLASQNLRAPVLTSIEIQGLLVRRSPG